MALGEELKFDDSLSFPERFYVRIFGVPINGLRIRQRHVLALVSDRYRNILDAGCGMGFFTYEIARRLPGSVLIGMDCDEKLIQRNIKLLQRISLKNCRFLCHDVTQPLTQGQYDLIISVDMLEHIAADETVLGNFFTGLKSGGELLLHVPAKERLGLGGKWQANFDVSGHLRFGYTSDEIREKVVAAGFQIVAERQTFGWWETMSNNISYLITGAEMRNKYLYALVFPLLNLMSWLGRNARPSRGAGILVVARK